MQFQASYSNFACSKCTAVCVRECVLWSSIEPAVYRGEVTLAHRAQLGGQGGGKTAVGGAGVAALLTPPGVSEATLGVLYLKRQKYSHKNTDLKFCRCPLNRSRWRKTMRGTNIKRKRLKYLPTKELSSQNSFWLDRGDGWSRSPLAGSKPDT